MAISFGGELQIDLQYSGPHENKNNFCKNRNILKFSLFWQRQNARWDFYAPVLPNSFDYFSELVGKVCPVPSISTDI